jgi:hypothetical protein
MRRFVFKGILPLLLLLQVGHALATDEDAHAGATENADRPPSNMESWQEEWRDEGKASGWTWFGMGYESRRAASPAPGGNNAGGPGKGAGGNGAGGGGKRR